MSEILQRCLSRTIPQQKFYKRISCSLNSNLFTLKTEQSVGTNRYHRKCYTVSNANVLNECYSKTQYLLAVGNLNSLDLFGRFFQTSEAAKMSDSKRDIIPLNEVKRFMYDCFVACEVPETHADLMADLLVAADYRGHFSHGMNRLEMYISDLLLKSTDGAAEPRILKETPATAWVDGYNGLGAVVGKFCMDLAIQKAKNIGVGWVCAKRSNHYGIAAWHTIHAEEQGLIGISMTNTSPLMCPTRSTKAVLGTNPISVSAPAKGNDSFQLDMATTAVAVGKIELQRRKGEPIPPGWAQDSNGKVTTDADVAFNASCLMPLGGSEITSGYKGFGLGAMVEILCGISAGSNFATHVRKWTVSGNKEEEANLGQVFIAVDPSCFAPGFEDRVSELNGILRNLPRVNPDKPVLVPGDPEHAHMQKVDQDGGIRYHVNQLKNCDSLATKLKVRPINSNGI